MTFDPNSNDAMFATVLNRLDNQDGTLKEILSEVRKTNGRVTKLETENAITRGKVALVSGIVSAAIGIVGWFLTKG